MIALTLHSEHDTEQVARLLAHAACDGDVIALVGDIGVGKTTFARHLARDLGVREPVRSPTFTIAHEYERDGGGCVAHLDLYRSTTMGAGEWADLEPYFDCAIVMVEWPAAALDWISERVTWHVALDHAGGSRRSLAISGRDANRMRDLADAAVALIRSSIHESPAV